ncbi:MAG: hypothetical protein ACYCQI_00525 [Gammaproteobacteria bacterium]
MPYTPPTLATQREFLRNLGPAHTKRDITRLKALLTIEEAKEQDVAKITTGGIIVEAEKIAVEYRKYCQDPIGGYLYSGSNLYKQLSTNALGITRDNPLDVETKLINTYSYYQYRKADLEDAKEIAELDDEIRPVVDNLIRQLPNTKAVLTARPSFTELLKRFHTQPQLYDQECKERWMTPSLEHIKFMQLIKLFTNPVMFNIVNSIKECQTDLAKTQFIYSACYGSLLYMMKQIEMEYAGLTVGSPTNSNIYRFCQKTLNLEHSTDVPDVFQINLLVDFARFIEATKDTPEAMKLLKTYKIKDGFFGPTYFTDADYHLDTILDKLETHLTRESFVWSCTKSVANYAFQTVLFMACIEVGAGMYAAGVGKDVLPIIFGRIGQEFMGGAMGARVMRVFAKQIEPTLIPTIYANAMWFGLHKFNNMLYPFKDPIYRTARLSKQFDVELKKELSEKQREPSEILMALIELPSKTVTPIVRKRVKEIIIEPIHPSLPDDLSSSDDYVRQEDEIQPQKLQFG